MITYGIDAHALLRGQATGVERYVAKLLEEMMRLPLEADEHVVLYGNGPKPDALVLPRGWSWKELGWIGRGWTHGRLSIEMMTNPPTVLFVPAHEVPLYVSAKTKVVTTLHDVAFLRVPEAYPSKARARQELAVRKAAARADRVITVSEATKRDLVDGYHIDAHKIAVTHLAPAITAAPSGDALERFRIRPQQYLLFIGRLEAKKNITHLVKSFAMAKQRLGVGHPLQLVLAGNYGYGDVEIRQAIAQSGVADAVRVLGYVNDADAAALYKSALAFVFPSKAEGFGIPMLEAMMFGTPVIASDIPVLHEVGGEACLYASSTDVAAFSIALERMVFDTGLRSTLIPKGRVRAAEFSWANTAQLTLEALRVTARKL